MLPTGYNQASQPPVSGAPINKDTAQGPTPESLNTQVLSEEEVKEWWVRIKASQARIKGHEASWDALFDEYLPTVEKSDVPENAKINAHFRNTSVKTGQLFVVSPDVQLEPRGPAVSPVMIMDPVTMMPRPMTAEEAVVIKQAVINDKMGPDGVDGVTLMDECLFDVLAWAGIAGAKVGYRVVIKPTPRPRMIPDPNAVPQPNGGGILGLAPAPPPPMIPATDPFTGQTIIDMVPVPIFHECYGVRINPKKLLLDEQLRSTRYEKESRWIGHEFFLPKRRAQRDFALTEDDLQKTAAKDDKVYEHKEDSTAGSQDANKDLVHGYEIFYKGEFFLDSELHPQALYQLVLIEGVEDKTIVSRKSPDQTFDELGMLTTDSLVGFPIKVLATRVVADSPYPPSDAAFVNTQAKGVNTHRRQSVQLRDVAIGKYAYDTDALDEEDLQKIKAGNVGDFIGLKAGMMAQGLDKVIAPIAQIRATQDDFRTSQVLKADMDETLGISAVQAGSVNTTVRSATEIANVAADSAGRQKKEQSRVIQFYVSIVRALDTLNTRYATGQDYITVVGDDGARKLQMWNKQIMMGRYAYSIKPDSQLRDDVAQDRQQALAHYTTLAPDPLFNRAPTIRKLARLFGDDPTKAIVTPEQMMMQPGTAKGGDPENKHTAEQSGGKENAPGASNRNDRNPDQHTEGAGPGLMGRGPSNVH